MRTKTDQQNYKSVEKKYERYKHDSLDEKTSLKAENRKLETVRAFCCQ